MSVQFLKHSGEKTFSVRDRDLDDCSCHDIKAAIKEGQFNCLSLFCFINFGIDHGFSKEISLCTLCVKSLK